MNSGPRALSAEREAEIRDHASGGWYGPTAYITQLLSALDYERQQHAETRAERDMAISLMSKVNTIYTDDFALARTDKPKGWWYMGTCYPKLIDAIRAAMQETKPSLHQQIVNQRGENTP